MAGTDQTGIGMKVVGAPWRMEYIKGKKAEGCIFCRTAGRDEKLVVCEGRSAFIIMNRYPYISGHVMVAPHRHVSGIEDLTGRERLEMFELLDLSLQILKGAYGPQGFNIGMNLGKAAGAGIDDHLHLHVVPRWRGDTNFMSVAGGVRVLPEDLPVTCGKLREALEAGRG